MHTLLNFPRIFWRIRQCIRLRWVNWHILFQFRIMFLITINARQSQRSVPMVMSFLSDLGFSYRPLNCNFWIFENFSPKIKRIPDNLNRCKIKNRLYFSLVQYVLNWFQDIAPESFMLISEKALEKIASGQPWERFNDNGKDTLY